MGQKDLTQKNLEEYPDVFADCVNALLYGGEPVLRACDLLPAPTESTYPEGEEGLRGQLQDVGWYEMEGQTVKKRYTLENQSVVDPKMVLRKSGYTGAIYRLQYQGKVRDLHPVISLVLYWGVKKWTAKGSLGELMAGKISLRDREYVDDVRLHVYEMQRLPPEVRARFGSDMRVVVDCLAEGKDYEPGDRKVRHVDAFLRLMCAVTGDEGYRHMIKGVTEQERKEGVKMCELLDKYWNGGVEEGMEKGLQEGENRMARLVGLLLGQEKISELNRALTDEEYRGVLFYEYGLVAGSEA